MITGQDLIGRSVIARDAGREIGTVKDLVVSDDGTRVVAFQLEAGGLLGGSRFVAWESIQSVGDDAVVIDSEESARKKDEFPVVKEILDEGKSLLGRTVHTTSGRTLGSIDAVFVEEKSGRVAGYELSGGTHAAEHGGRSFLPASADMETGKDVVFVPPEAEASLEDMHVVRSEHRKAA